MQRCRAAQVVGGTLAIGHRGRDLRCARGGGLRLRPALADQCLEPRLLEHRDRVAPMHGVAFVLEEPRQPAGREGGELELADLDGPAHAQRVAVAATPRAEGDGGEREGLRGSAHAARDVSGASSAS